MRSSKKIVALALIIIAVSLCSPCANAQTRTPPPGTNPTPANSPNLAPGAAATQSTAPPNRYTDAVGLTTLVQQQAEQDTKAVAQEVSEQLISTGETGDYNETYLGLKAFYSDDVVSNLFANIGQLLGRWMTEWINGWVSDTVQFLTAFLRVFVLNPNVAVNQSNTGVGGGLDNISPYIRAGADVVYGIAVDLLLLLFILCIWKYWVDAAWRGSTNLMGAVGRLIATAGLMLAWPTIYAFEVQITNEMIKAIYFNSADQVAMLDQAMASTIKAGLVAGVGLLANAFAPVVGSLAGGALSEGAGGLITGTVGDAVSFAGLVIYLLLGTILIVELIYILILKAVQTALLVAQYMFAPIFLVFFATPDTENVATGYVRSFVEVSLWTFIWVGLLKIMVILLFSDFNPWGKLLMAIGILQMMIQTPYFMSRAQISPASEFISAGLLTGGLLRGMTALGNAAKNRTAQAIDYVHNQRYAARGVPQTGTVALNGLSSRPLNPDLVNQLRNHGTASGQALRPNNPNGNTSSQRSGATQTNPNQSGGPGTNPNNQSVQKIKTPNSAPDSLDKDPKNQADAQPPQKRDLMTPEQLKKQQEQLRRQQQQQQQMQEQQRLQEQFTPHSQLQQQPQAKSSERRLKEQQKQQAQMKEQQLAQQANQSEQQQPQSSSTHNPDGRRLQSGVTAPILKGDRSKKNSEGRPSAPQAVASPNFERVDDDQSKQAEGLLPAGKERPVKRKENQAQAQLDNRSPGTNALQSDASAHLPGLSIDKEDKPRPVMKPKLRQKQSTNAGGSSPEPVLNGIETEGEKDRSAESGEQISARSIKRSDQSKTSEQQIQNPQAPKTSQSLKHSPSAKGDESGETSPKSRSTRAMPYRIGRALSRPAVQNAANPDPLTVPGGDDGDDAEEQSAQPSAPPNPYDQWNQKYFKDPYARAFAADVRQLKRLLTNSFDSQGRPTATGSARGGVTRLGLGAKSNDVQNALQTLAAGYANMYTLDPEAYDALREAAIESGADRPQGIFERMAAGFLAHNGRSFKQTTTAKARFNNALAGLAANESLDYVNGREGGKYTQYLRDRLGPMTPESQAWQIHNMLDPDSSESGWNPKQGMATDMCLNNGILPSAANRAAASTPHIQRLIPSMKPDGIRGFGTYLKAAAEEIVGKDAHPLIKDATVIRLARESTHAEAMAATAIAQDSECGVEDCKNPALVREVASNIARGADIRTAKTAYANFRSVMNAQSEPGSDVDPGESDYPDFDGGPVQRIRHATATSSARAVQRGASSRGGLSSSNVVHVKEQGPPVQNEGIAGDSLVVASDSTTSHHRASQSETVLRGTSLSESSSGSDVTVSLEGRVNNPATTSLPTGGARQVFGTGFNNFAARQTGVTFNTAGLGTSSPLSLTNDVSLDLVGAPNLAAVGLPNLQPPATAAETVDVNATASLRAAGHTQPMVSLPPAQLSAQSPLQGRFNSILSGFTAPQQTQGFNTSVEAVAEPVTFAQGAFTGAEPARTAVDNSMVANVAFFNQPHSAGAAMSRIDLNAGAAVQGRVSANAISAPTAYQQNQAIDATITSSPTVFQGSPSLLGSINPPPAVSDFSATLRNSPSNPISSQAISAQSYATTLPGSVRIASVDSSSAGHTQEVLAQSSTSASANLSHSFSLGNWTAPVNGETVFKVSNAGLQTSGTSSINSAPVYSATSQSGSVRMASIDSSPAFHTQEVLAQVSHSAPAHPVETFSPGNWSLPVNSETIFKVSNAGLQNSGTSSINSAPVNSATSQSGSVRMASIDSSPASHTQEVFAHVSHGATANPAQNFSAGNWTVPVSTDTVFRISNTGLQTMGVTGALSMPVSAVTGGNSAMRFVDSSVSSGTVTSIFDVQAQTVGYSNPALSALPNLSKLTSAETEFRLLGGNSAPQYRASSMSLPVTAQAGPATMRVSGNIGAGDNINMIVDATAAPTSSSSPTMPNLSFLSGLQKPVNAVVDLNVSGSVISGAHSARQQVTLPSTAFLSQPMRLSGSLGNTGSADSVSTIDVTPAYQMQAPAMPSIPPAPASGGSHYVDVNFTAGALPAISSNETISGQSSTYTSTPHVRINSADRGSVHSIHSQVNYVNPQQPAPAPISSVAIPHLSGGTQAINHVVDVNFSSPGNTSSNTVENITIAAADATQVIEGTPDIRISGQAPADTDQVQTTHVDVYSRSAPVSSSDTNAAVADVQSRDYAQEGRIHVTSQVLGHMHSAGFSDQQIQTASVARTCVELYQSDPSMIYTASVALNKLGDQHFNTQNVYLFQEMIEAGWDARQIERPYFQTALQLRAQSPGGGLEQLRPQNIRNAMRNRDHGPPPFGRR
jgi:hypothetical protein